MISDFLSRILPWMYKPALYIMGAGTIWAMISRYFYRFLAQQLRQPSGFFGKAVISQVLKQMNEPLIQNIISKIHFESNVKTILDIGCGPGNTFPSLISRLVECQCQEDFVIHGVDWSSAILEHCTETFKESIDAQRIVLHQSDMSKMPFADKFFDVALGFDIVHFQVNIAAFMKEIARVVKPGGKLYIGVKDPSYFIREPEVQSGIHLGIYKIHTVWDIVRAMESNGFSNIQPPMSELRNKQAYDITPDEISMWCISGVRVATTD